MKKCIIVGAGEFASDIFLKIYQACNNQCILYACDGGIEYLLNLNVKPDLFIGDMDSVSYEILQQIEKNGDFPVLKLPTNKDDTDILAALRIGLEQGSKEFFLFGALGNRLDHSYGNISLLSFLVEQNARGMIFGQREILEVICDETKQFDPDRKGIISVFSVSEQSEGVSIKGLKYELDHATLSSAIPIGVSNEFLGKKSTISVKKGKLLLIYQQ